MNDPTDAPNDHVGGDHADTASKSSSRAMTLMRSGLMAVGLFAGLYGAWLLWDFPFEVIIRIAVWVAAGVLLHDFGFAPVTAVLGHTSRRWIKRAWWTPVVVAGACSATLMLLAVPVLDTPGAKADNPSLLDRDYPLGLVISLGVVWACVPIYLVIAGRRQRHRDVSR